MGAGPLWCRIKKAADSGDFGASGCAESVGGGGVNRAFSWLTSNGFDVDGAFTIRVRPSLVEAIATLTIGLAVVGLWWFGSGMKAAYVCAVQAEPTRQIQPVFTAWGERRLPGEVRP